MNLREVKPQPRDIPLGLINPPVLPARSQMDEQKLEELVHSIAKHGVIQRLIVVPDADRYEVIAGHRRYLASLRAGLAVVPCDVYPTKDVALEAVKHAENRFREDMSAAEEALYFAELLDRDYGGDIEALAAGLGEKVSYVDGRLQLVLGDKDVFQALMDRKITIGVAHELNKCPAADWRRHYLHHAIRGGATVAMVTGWITDWKRLYDSQQQPQTEPAAAAAPVAAPAYDPQRCYVCGESDPRYVPELLSVHTHCRLAVLDRILRGEAAANS